MNLHVDNLLALAIVAVAVFYIARRGVGMLAGKRSGGCGTCSTCPAQGSSAGPQVIGLDTVRATAGQAQR